MLFCAFNFEIPRGTTLHRTVDAARDGPPHPGHPSQLYPLGYKRWEETSVITQSTCPAIRPNPHIRFARPCDGASQKRRPFGEVLSSACGPKLNAWRLLRWCTVAGLAPGAGSGCLRGCKKRAMMWSRWICLAMTVRRALRRTPTWFVMRSRGATTMWCSSALVVGQHGSVSRGSPTGTAFGVLVRPGS
jgi:hypothetical protein